jgi:hypothetical protein
MELKFDDSKLDNNASFILCLLWEKWKHYKFGQVSSVVSKAVETVTLYSSILK